MRVIGNILWLIPAGLLIAFGWAFSGIFGCITIVGIPWGIQCFKFAKLALLPFGRDVVYGGGFGSLILNILWLVLSGLWLAAGTALIGCFLCVTLIGIPFGLQCFKLAKLALYPYGTTVT